LLRDYEILYIVRPDLDDDQLNAAIGTVDTLISNLGGEKLKTDIWGRRRLAYEVSHLREGHYVLTDFKVEPERVPEMEATLKISDTVFRHLIVRKPDGRKGPAVTAATAATAAATATAAEAPEAAAATPTADADAATEKDDAGAAADEEAETPKAAETAEEGA
jgi:small subunit ribosomal protein S6